MITDEIIEAIDMMAELAKDPKHIAGIMAVREMLADFNPVAWTNLFEFERKILIEDYLP